MIQRQAGAVPVYAAEQQICCFSMVESSAVEQRRRHGCYRNLRCHTFDKFPKDVDLVPSDIVRSSTDETVEITQLDTIRIDQSQVADAEVGEF